MNKIQLRVCVAFIVIVLTLCGCVRVNYSNQAMGIVMDMTKEEVLIIMGPPRKNAARKTPDGVIERYSWWSPTYIGFSAIDLEMMAADRVFVAFKNGKVIEWGDKYDYSDAMDKTRESQTDFLKNSQNKNNQTTIENKQSPPPD